MAELELVKKVEQLQKSNRRVMIATMCLAFVFGGSCFLGAGYNEQGEIRASRFVLVDETGKERATIQLVDNEPSMAMIGSSGTKQVSLGIDRAHGGAAALRLLSVDKGALFSATATPRNILTVSGQNGLKKFLLTTSQPDTAPWLEMRDEEGRQTVKVQ